MRTAILGVLALLTAAAAAACVLFAAMLASGQAPAAHADYFSYPCQYPAQGTGGGVNMIANVGGQWCDWPTEVNWSHYHCEGGGANVNLGAFAFAPVGPVSLGGFGGSGIGGHLEDCYFRCPDGERAPTPNPPAKWITHMVLNPKDNDCVGHMGIRGDTSTPLQNALPGNMQPGEDPPEGVAVPASPGALPEGQHNPPALPGPPPPEPPPPPAAPPAEGASLLAPGSPLPMP